MRTGAELLFSLYFRYYTQTFFCYKNVMIDTPSDGFIVLYFHSKGIHPSVCLSVTISCLCNMCYQMPKMFSRKNYIYKDKYLIQFNDFKQSVKTLVSSHFDDQTNKIIFFKYCIILLQNITWI
jgi:hypothetical protein